MESIRFTRKEEAALCQRMRQGDQEARELLAKSVLGWAYSYAFRMEGGMGKLSQDVVESAACMAVAQALETFDPEKGRLTTHVSFLVLANVNHERRNRHLIHIPFDLLENTRKGSSSSYMLRERAELALAIASLNLVVRIRRDRRIGSRRELVDRHPSPDKICEEADDRSRRLECCKFALEELGGRFPRHVQVLRLRIGEGMIFDDIAKRLGVSRERVRQIEAKGLAFVRQRAAELMARPRSTWRRKRKIKIGS